MIVKRNYLFSQGVEGRGLVALTTADSGRREVRHLACLSTHSEGGKWSS